jgi:hypothetical protein
MTLHKTTSSVIDRVICNSEVEEAAEDFEETKGSSFPGIYSEMRAICGMSLKYENDVDIFTKLAESLPTITDPYIRGSMLESISSVLGEIGALATQIFKSDDSLLKASSDVIYEKIMLPTIKLREALVKMKEEKSAKQNSLDIALGMVDRMMDAVNMKTLDIDGSAKYAIVDRSSSN